MEFDEEKAINYINQQLSTKYDEDEILNIIDIIFDYYEDNDMLDINCDDDDDDETIINALTCHVTKMLKKDPYTTIQEQDIEKIVRAEYEYEQSIGFDEL